jgi:hypothetical protein
MLVMGIQAQDMTPLVQKVRAKIEQVKDYVAVGTMKTDVSFIKAPIGKVKVYFKKPDLFSIKKEGGIVYCLPWTRIEFLISKQDLIHSYRVQACPTYDNIYVELDLSVIFRCKQDDESIYNFCYRISTNQLNE